jgi:hypothetical protein
MLASGSGVQWPSLPEARHVSHGPVHAVLQHTPSAQKPEAHWPCSLQLPPLETSTSHWPSTQRWPEPQSTHALPSAPHAVTWSPVTHSVPLQQPEHVEESHDVEPPPPPTWPPPVPPPVLPPPVPPPMLPPPAPHPLGDGDTQLAPFGSHW